MFLWAHLPRLIYYVEVSQGHRFPSRLCIGGSILHAPIFLSCTTSLWKFFLVSTLGPSKRPMKKNLSNGPWRETPNTGPVIMVIFHAELSLQMNISKRLHNVWGVIRERKTLSIRCSDAKNQRKSGGVSTWMTSLLAHVRLTLLRKLSLSTF